ncbi:protein unc-13 homolog 4B-like [Sycon ciliatum]|uniref:protein unc-13 homolog 4B-like n=1 Tax=Sycon ciliatum TaxID=27933 RepID=UPI0031F6BF58
MEATGTAKSHALPGHCYRGYQSNSAAQTTTVCQQSSWRDDLTGSGFDHGSQTSIQLQHARLGEASDTEVDNAHPSFSVSTTESMYAHVPLSELVKDLPHIKKEMVCVLYRETLTTIMSRLGADERPEVSVRSLVHYADQLFNIPPAVSKSWVADINSTACKASQLIVDVIEAKGLAAMDANGFSDPYVLLSIEQPQSTKTDVANIIKAVHL